MYICIYLNNIIDIEFIWSKLSQFKLYSIIMHAYLNIIKYNQISNDWKFNATSSIS